MLKIWKFILWKVRGLNDTFGHFLTVSSCEVSLTAWTNPSLTGRPPEMEGHQRHRRPRASLRPLYPPLSHMQRFLQSVVADLSLKFPPSPISFPFKGIKGKREKKQHQLQQFSPSTQYPLGTQLCPEARWYDFPTSLSRIKLKKVAIISWIYNFIHENRNYIILLWSFCLLALTTAS